LTDIRRFVVAGSTDLDAVLATCVVDVGLEVVADEHFERTWLDTATGSLRADHGSLEHRRPLDADRAASLWWSADGRTLAHDDCVSTTVPTSIDDLPGGPGFDRLRARLADAPLVAGPISTTRLVTLARLDDETKTTARVRLDLSTGEGIDPVVAVELVALRGFTSDADDVERLLRRSLRVEPVSISVRERFERSRRAAGPGSSRAIDGSDLDPAMDAAAAWRTVLRSLAARFDAHLDGAIDGSDPEDLHRLRVAIRRARTVLTDGEGVIEERSRKMFRKDFAWLGEATTPTRDADVHLERIPVLIAGLPGDRRRALLPFLEVLRAERANRHHRMVVALRSERFIGFRSEWTTFLGDDDAWSDRRAGVDSTRGSVPAASRRIDAAHSRLVRDGRRIAKKSPAKDLHDLRKRAKHLRYLLECFGPLFDPDDVDAVVRPLRSLQEVLGDFQDSEVEAAELRSIARDVSMSRADEKAFDGLIEGIERRGRTARKEFAAAFSDLDTKKVRRAMGRIATTKGPKR